MNIKHNRNFLDILTEEEKVYYTNYKSGDSSLRMK